MAFSSPRFITGCAILFLVDILWTASSELTEHLYKQKHYNKPFFTAYVKSIMFTVYLFGFIFCDSWWSNSNRSSEYYSSIAENDQQNLTIDEEDDDDEDEEEEDEDDMKNDQNNDDNELKKEKDDKKKNKNKEFDDDENEKIERSINANKEEFEEINLNQPNVIINTAQEGGDVHSRPDSKMSSFPKASSSKQLSNIKSPYIGEAIWLPISGCSDTSSISGKSDEEDALSDVDIEEHLKNINHLNETDDDKLLLIRNETGDTADNDNLQVDIIQSCSNNQKSEASFVSAIKQHNNKKNHRKRSVRFSKLMEVRHMTAKHAEDAFLSRLSYSAFMRHIYQKTHQLPNTSNRHCSRSTFPNTSFRSPTLNIKETALLAFYFTSIWFTANLSFHFGLHYSEAGLVNVLSSTTPLFTLLLGLIFPSGVSNDSVSVTKLLAVALFISSVAVISTTEPIEPTNIVNSSSFTFRQTSSFSSSSSSQLLSSNNSTFPIGSLWTLCGAFFYAVYIVLMRYNVLHDSMLNFPMFFGFIGLFSLILMWPFILLLDFTQLELFEWPDNEQWFYLLVNGLCGTVISELLFLLGSFLTSSLVGTIAVSFTIPMAVFFDMFFKDITYPGIFFLGTVPMMLSFIVIILVSQYSDWDPIMSCIRKFINYFNNLSSSHHHHAGSSTARYRNMNDDTSILQNLDSNQQITNDHHSGNEESLNTSIIADLDSTKLSSSSSSSSPIVNTNCNRRFERFNNVPHDDDDADMEQTQALINDHDNSL